MLSVMYKSEISSVSFRSEDLAKKTRMDYTCEVDKINYPRLNKIQNRKGSRTSCSAK